MREMLCGLFCLNACVVCTNLVIILVAIIGVSSVVCVVIICVGATWLCRYNYT